MRTIYCLLFLVAAVQCTQFWIHGAISCQYKRHWCVSAEILDYDYSKFDADDLLASVQKICGDEVIKYFDVGGSMDTDVGNTFEFYVIYNHDCTSNGANTVTNADGISRDFNVDLKRTKARLFLTQPL
ncbi:unnamed protein product [Caenorhabditis sp. 36 PRJEB53466]|nr:unnamed protein product [Caenorhabditis sp. 36 PRJEB53466]